MTLEESYETIGDDLDDDDGADYIFWCPDCGEPADVCWCAWYEEDADE